MLDKVYKFLRLGLGMVHKAKDFSHLLGKIRGISDKQLLAHFALYNGYVKKLNEIETKLKTQDKSATNYSFGEFSELKRREAVAFNGAYLHDLYFSNLTGKATKPSLGLKAAIKKAFGSWDTWVQDLKSSAASTPGWVVLTKNKIDGQVHNYIVYEHHIGLPVHQEIIMALDCWEHAFMIDYGTDKASYVKAFLDNVDWKVVSKRFKQA